MAVRAEFLYKYTQAQYADRMVDDGLFWIGTLHSYRREWEHGTEVGDQQEGQKRIEDLKVTGDYTEIVKRPNLLTSLIKIHSPVKRGQLRFVGVNFAINHDHPDAYVYCVSQEWSVAAQGTFGDACIRISQPVRFIQALHKAMVSLRLGTGCIADPCQYGSRVRSASAEDGVHPAFLKDVGYSHQKEVRALWRPFSYPIKPQLIGAYNAAKYLERIPLPIE